MKKNVNIGYLVFLEEFSNPLRIKSLRASSKNEVMNWQPF